MLRLSEDMPLVIEIVDGEEAIERYLEPLNAILDEAGAGAMVTLERVEILHYRPAEPGP